MQFTVLSLAYPWAPVGPQAVGGAEAILTALDAALTARGHRSLVVAAESSTTAGTLFPVSTPGGVLDHASEVAVDSVNAAIQRALESAPVDLIHCHGIDFHRYALPEDIPVLVTLHMPPGWYPDQVLERCPPNMTLVCVSENQRKTCPVITELIPNGVALGLRPEPVTSAREPFALALGRICPEKNLHAALQAGSLAGIQVLLGGQVFPYTTHLDYFQQTLEPLLVPPHRFLGPLPPEQRRSLLEQAIFLLLPSLAPETSSLVAMEALAAGTPVIAYPSGAIPEIVEDGVTGFLVDSVPAMASALKRAGTLSREHCRAVAETRFGELQMIRSYFELYGRLAKVDLCRS